MAKILNRYTGEVMFEGENKTIRQLALENQADLSGANLRSADLRSADLRSADLRSADLSGADLRSADLSGADLSGKFEQDDLGLIVYKRIKSGYTQFRPPNDWEIKKGAIISETPNPNRVDECGCGVNFGTFEWCKGNYTRADLWLCRINWIDLADVCVPFNSDGKARCARLTLISKLTEKQIVAKTKKLEKVNL
jgi:uncharacterized protein YjbI with pentapeptide repeats